MNERHKVPLQILLSNTRDDYSLTLNSDVGYATRLHIIILISTTQRNDERGDVLGSSIIGKIVNLTRILDLDLRARQTQLGMIESFLENILLARSARYESYSEGMIENGVGEGNSCRGRFRRIVEPSYPAIFFVKEGVAWEKGAGVSTAYRIMSSVYRFSNDDERRTYSGPIPSKQRSKRGKATESLPTKAATSCFSYSSAQASGSSSRETSIV